MMPFSHLRSFPLMTNFSLEHGHASVSAASFLQKRKKKSTQPFAALPTAAVMRTSLSPGQFESRFLPARSKHARDLFHAHTSAPCVRANPRQRRWSILHDLRSLATGHFSFVYLYTSRATVIYLRHLRPASEASIQDSMENCASRWWETRKVFIFSTICTIDRKTTEKSRE